ncbi:MAG: hypothetical protein HOC28_02620 [Bacteroidetes Order II. Incertae sedis bacterium]|jgi:hypothetical protein|nr:hypothetical protein [Bacteroidetes Order II. bacterium]MBT4052985.1 hypothetical protein [Bacteroidetes Order II. bacterium]MBT4602007.1 hypothetical protein [Bacteroidetes Order II. bacterium]MBT5249124.1 hypothetical protein [Bacteroidetes Order II. bacterium]MBT6199486.1 hypothetical protein [Bacteroidetes Order II. bacterium]
MLKTRLPIAIAALALLTVPVFGQASALERGSDNMEVLGHVPLGKHSSVTDIELEQDLDRPYAYIGRASIVDGGPKGMDVIDLSDPAHPEVVYRFRLDNQDLLPNRGGMDVKYFRTGGRHYVVQSFEFSGGPEYELGAVVFDVTDLPSPDGVKEVARLELPDNPGGMHNIFIYKHTSGHVYLLATVRGDMVQVFDLEKVVNGDVANAYVSTIPTPESPNNQGDSRFYHDHYAAYHPDTGEDRFYGGGNAGYYIYDISDIENPELKITLTGISGVSWGHTFTPSPDGRFVVAESEYQYSPLRIFDLKPALDGDVTNIRQPISAWTADWKNLSHNHEVRWPFVFVSAYLDGLQVFSLMDPENPQTVGYYDTYVGPTDNGFNAVINGAFGVDVRNEDGLIVISDMSTGFWTFKMDGFNGWNGEDWGMPNISSVQNWDEESKEGTK